MTERRLTARKSISYKVLSLIFLLLIPYIFLISFTIFPIIFPGNLYADTENNIENTENGLRKDNILKKSDIVAESALVMDYKTGDILWEKNSTKKMFPASITKILASIIAIENIRNFNEVVEIPKNASGKNHSAFRFRTGDKISLIDLIKAALICSHNNATIALAEYISGSEEEFVHLMNLKAKEIGATDSYFQNTNGLDEDYPYHKSTAKDLALIARYCLKNDLFRQIVNTSRDWITINDKQIEISNTNKLLSYSYIKGIKTGYTEKAGFCIALYSNKDNLELITVILNSTQDSREEDAMTILNWVYNNFDYEKIVDSSELFKTIKVGSSSIVNIDLYPESDYTRLINVNSDKVDIRSTIDTDIDLPIYKNQVLGTLDIYINDEKEKEINLISKDSIEKPYIHQELTTIKELQSRKILIFLISFYFFIFIFIIVRNLFTKKTYYS